MDAVVKQGFSGMPTLRPYPFAESKALWTLCSEFYYVAKDGTRYEAPVGMLTDLASIPPVAQWVYESVDTRLCGVIHDFLYMTSLTTNITKARADALFAEMMTFSGASGFQAWSSHAGLEIGGWHSWDECQHLGVHWADFDTSVMSANQIEQARSLYNLDRIAA